MQESQPQALPIVHLRAHKIVKGLGFCFLVIFALNAVSLWNFYETGLTIKRINFNDEHNVPTYFGGFRGTNLRPSTIFATIGADFL